MSWNNIHKYIYHLILIPLFILSAFNTLAQESKGNKKVIYAKLKSSSASILQPWSRTYIEDRDYPAEMLSPSSYKHLLHPKTSVFSNTRFFPREVPDILEIHLKDGASVEQSIIELKKHPLVEYVEVEDFVDDLQYIPNDPRSGEQFSISLHNLYEAWNISRGNPSVVIGLHDSGFQVDHEDLTNNLYENTAEINGFDGVDDDNNGYIDDFHGWNFTKNSNDLTGTDHGTTVAGNGTASSDNNIGTTGSGFHTTYLPTVRSALSSLVYVAEQPGVKIINMSWGSNSTKSIAYQEIISFYAEDAEYDILFVAAAGNNTHGNVPTDYYPACYENVLAVTGVDANRVNRNRTRGYLIDVAGADGSLAPHKDNSYGNGGGTSYASPTVAGIAGLVRAHYPDLTAKQVAELIRFTSDSTFYSETGNENLNYLQGFGIVDAHLALTQRDNIHVVRASNIKWSKLNTDDISITPGDTMEVWFDFQNILNGNSNLRIEISSYSDDFTPISNEISIGQLSELQTTNNSSFPFTFKLEPSGSVHSNHYFRLDFYDDANNYHDWQNVELNITLEQYISFNYLYGYFRPEGTLGTRNGLNYNSHQITRQAGFMVVADNKVVDATYTNPESDIRSADFVGTTPIALEYAPTVDENYPIYQYNTSFADEDADQPIGIEIDQKLFGRFIIDREKSIFTELKITNRGNGTFDSVRVGLFTDWMMSFEGSSISYPLDSGEISYDPTTQTIIAKHARDTRYAAVRLLNEGQVHVQCLDQKDGTSDIDISDGFSDAEKIQSLTSGIGTINISNGASGTNVSSVIGVSLPSVKINEEVRVGFLVSVADSYDELITQLDSTEVTAQYWLKSPSPVVAHQIAHQGEYVDIHTSNFDSLALYKKESSNSNAELISRGRIFQVLIDSIDHYYVQSQGRYVYNGDLIQLTGDAIPILSVSSPMNVCKNTNVIIAPAGCNSYNFYDNELLVTPLYSGKTLTLTDISSDTLFYITCAELTSENDYTKVDILVDEVITDYSLSDSTSHIGGSITAEFTQIDKARTWSWYMDGEKVGDTDDISITPSFTEAGTHQLRLFASNLSGCTYIISKEIEVSVDNVSSSVVSILENSIVYPNPVVNHQVNISTVKNVGKMKFDLYTVEGVKIEESLPYKINGNTYEIHLPKHIPSHTYILKGQADGGSNTWKIAIH
ncbi:S8 family serine peptidase [Flammeovirga agarivorans]|uniref:S8 family serine peptidase n=1 Tax=Flammeovirga agarivorans TaxID=2726742 RepID=A0A7X8SGT8_9BACT|nr:S8 family serine peptidase [Flammeovirga agarivorans]NLR89983.1 S8 family serine peptidase [Flammeovirga agarivorans]